MIKALSNFVVCIQGHWIQMKIENISSSNVDWVREFISLYVHTISTTMSQHKCSRNLNAKNNIYTSKTYEQTPPRRSSKMEMEKI